MGTEPAVAGEGGVMSKIELVDVVIAILWGIACWLVACWFSGKPKIKHTPYREMIDDWP